MKNSTLQHNVFAHRSKYILFFMVLLIIGGIIWVFASIYASQNNTSIPEEAKLAASSLDPNLNLKLLDNLGNKKIYSTEELIDFPIFIITTDRFTRSKSVQQLDAN